jgi:sulfite reductase (NADPH) flavoprotein alpha-component
MASFDAFFARAQQQAHAWTMMMMRLPPPGDGPVTVMIQEPSAPHMFARSQLTLNRSSAEILKWEPYAAARTGRKLRVWVRGLHTGEAFGFVGQTVAGLASLGGCFLVWTGFAMAWRRFRYRKRDAEDVTALVDVARPTKAQPILPSSVSQISQTAKEPTLADMEQVTSGINEYTHIGLDQTAVGWSGTSIESDSALILYGTVTGNAERLANRLAGKLRAEGITVHVLDMARCEPRVLTRANCVLMVISTYGDGEPPEDAAPFWEGVVRGGGLDLRGVRFSVLALGNTTFDQFCKCGRDLDAAMERHGAIRFFRRVDCDAIYDDSAAHWLDGVLASLKEINRPAISA